MADKITKDISELTDADRARLYPIILCDYNPEWAEWYRDEKEIIEKAVGIENIVSLQHIGSTAVPGLKAKPTVDILLEIAPQADIAKLKAAFPYPGYICLDRQTVQTHDVLLFLKGYTIQGFADKVFHIHVRYAGDWDEVHFRNYLIANPETAKEYAALKRCLKDKHTFDRDAYTNAKGEFVAKITAKARGNRPN